MHEGRESTCSGFWLKWSWYQLAAVVEKEDQGFIHNIEANKWVAVLLSLASCVSAAN